MIVPIHTTASTNTYIRLCRCSFTSPLHNVGVAGRYKFRLLTSRTQPEFPSSVTNSKKMLRRRRIRVRAVYIVIILFHVYVASVWRTAMLARTSPSEYKSRKSMPRRSDVRPECTARGLWKTIVVARVTSENVFCHRRRTRDDGKRKK